MADRTYLCIDLKSFYASVECVERSLNPLTTNLVVADLSRTEKTICLAVTPSLKAFGIPGRARLFEVIQRVGQVNAQRLKNAPGGRFGGKSYDRDDLRLHPDLALDYIVAPPRMAHYLEYSTRIYSVYLKHVAPEDIHVYSIDEVFIDLTPYLRFAKMSAYEFARMLINDVLETTGITATAGIGTNMYLAKVAMDITAKHISPDKDGVRIAFLDEMSYRRKLWSHRPLTDFWRIGPGYAKKLEANGMFTMGDVARCSVRCEDLLYKLFGVNAQLLIDHAWGWEPCTIADIKAYKPAAKSISSGQVLHCPYTADKARLITCEMIEALSLDLTEKQLLTNQIVLSVGYDRESLTDPDIAAGYTGPIVTDHYGRRVPKHAHGTVNLQKHTSSSRLLTDAVTGLYDRIVNPKLLVRRITLAACRLLPESQFAGEQVEQMSLFTDYEAQQRQRETLEKERRLQYAMLNIKQKYGKNAILKGMNFVEGATARDRNAQIGGHKA